MPENTQFPFTPQTFFVQRTPTKARVFVGQLDFNSAEITPVTTVNVTSEAEADRLIAALKTAAWTGDREQWRRIVAELPEAVVLACEQALASMSPHESLMLGSDGVPMTVLRTSFVGMPNDGDLLPMLSGASESSLQILVDNYRGDGDDVHCRARLLSGETEITQEQISGLWPSGDGALPIERCLFGDSELEAVLADERWLTQRARIYWVWLADSTPEEHESGSYGAELNWVVEYFDQAVPEDPEPDVLEEYEQFVMGDWNPWPLTARTRFVLWNSLTHLLAMLETGLALWEEAAAAPNDDDFMQDYPKITWSQSRAWWVSLAKACERLVDAMRTGEYWNPRTPAEEALIYVACQEGWIDAAREMIDMTSSLRRQFAALPEGAEPDFDDLDADDDIDGGLDFEWGEVPGALAGDEDIALLWVDSMDGIEDPDDPANTVAGIGDYRVSSWHERFDQYRREPNLPSSLF